MQEAMDLPHWHLASTIIQGVGVACIPGDIGCVGCAGVGGGTGVDGGCVGLAGVGIGTAIVGVGACVGVETGAVGATPLAGVTVLLTPPS